MTVHACKWYIFQSCNKSTFNSVCFDVNPFTGEHEKENISNCTPLLVVFKWHHSSDKVKEKRITYTEQFCPSEPDSEAGTETCFIKLVLEVVKTMHPNERREVTTAFGYSHMPQSSKFLWISLHFTNFSSIMSKCQCYTLREVLAEVFVDEDGDFDPDVASSLSIQEIFLSLSFTNCWNSER